MLMTVTNLQTTAMNALDTLTGGVGVSALLATGGSRVDPLPHPFQHVVLEAAGGADALQLPVHPADFTHQAVPHLTQTPSTQWNMLVAAGKVTVAMAAQTDTVDQFELADAAW